MLSKLFAALAILRELGPVLTAILVGGKVASGIAAELGSMKVTEQIDALRTLGVNHIKRLVVPRMIAAVAVFPMLTVLADVLGVLGGMVIMYLERGADMYAYVNTTTYWVIPRDFLTGIGKSVFFGAIVTLIGCYNGLSVEGGTEGRIEPISEIVAFLAAPLFPQFVGLAGDSFPHPFRQLDCRSGRPG